MATIRDMLRNASAQLKAVSDEPQTDAEYLLTEVMGLSTTQLILQAEQVISKNEQQRFDQLVKRRLTGEPIAYIIGRKDFHQISLNVSPDVLIPRSDTELLVEQALQLIATDEPVTVLDLGTGSGAIALSIAMQRPQAKITAVEQSAAACEMARQNLAQLGLNNVTVLCGCWFESIESDQFSVIVSNPPYISQGDPHLKKGDLRFEPQSALVASDNGLACFKQIAASAKQHLVAGGSLLFEHGFDQAKALRQILIENQYINIQTYPDLSGHDRVTVGVGELSIQTKLSFVSQ